MSSILRPTERRLAGRDKRERQRGQRYGGLPSRMVWPPGGADFSDKKAVNQVFARIEELREQGIEAEVPWVR